jgi:hypothetical protein
MGGVLTDLVRWVIDVVHSLGYVGVFVLILAGSEYLPVPTELTLPLFGFLIGNGRLSFAPVLLAATAARVCAALVMYAVGFRLREARLRRVTKHVERAKLLLIRAVPRPACPAKVPNTRPMPQPLIAIGTQLLAPASAPARVNVIRPSLSEVFSSGTTPYFLRNVR